jgi:hypothetical protein
LPSRPKFDSAQKYGQAAATQAQVRKLLRAGDAPETLAARNLFHDLPVLEPCPVVAFLLRRYPSGKFE